MFNIKIDTNFSSQQKTNMKVNANSLLYTMDHIRPDIILLQETLVNEQRVRNFIHLFCPS
jgi:hypothetical protein